MYMRLTYSPNRVQKFSSAGTFHIDVGQHGKRQRPVSQWLWWHRCRFGRRCLRLRPGQPPGSEVHFYRNVHHEPGERAGTGDNQFDSPQDIAVDSSNNVYVVDTSNNRVQKFTSTGTFITKWGTSGSGDGQFNGPQGIAVDSSGTVYVADYRQ